MSRSLVALVTFAAAATLLIALLSVQPNAPNVHIVVRYPKTNLLSSIVSIRGSGCGLTWTKGALLQQTGTDAWAVDLTCTKGVSVEVKILENDTNWMLGQNYKFTPMTDTPTAFQVFPSFHPKANAIADTAAVSSKLLNNSRQCSIYYPPSYFDNIYKQYPLLIMHDGQNLFEDAKSAFGAWKIQNTLNEQIATGAIQEVIVVGVWNTNNRNNEYTYSYDKTEKFGGKGDLYLDFLQQELMPQIRKWLNGRLLNQRLAIGGSSLGGLISCYAAYTRPDVYDRAICMSSSFWWNNEDFSNIILKNKTDVKLYLDSGDAGTSQDGKNQTLNAKAKLERIGYQINTTLFYYLDQGGQHNEYYWGRRFNVPMSYLYG